jgi:preprotein translocase SecF subunit
MRVKIPFIDFVGIRRYAFILSLSVCVIGIVFYFIRGGFNMGIDFKGGIVVQVKTSDKADIHAVRQAMSSHNLAAQIQDLGDPSAHEFLIKTPSLAKGNVEVVNAIETALVESLGAENVVLPFQKTDVVGPTMSKYLTRQAFLLVLLSMICMFIYITVRFKWDFAAGAIIALFHDPIVVLTAMLITDKEITVSIIAAVLTLIGYSINDTIVIFDRIREAISKYRDLPFHEIANKAINETLSRTIITVLTVVFAVVALFFFGGSVIHDFMFALLVGVITGTYSSIFIASAFVVEWRDFAAKRRVDKSARQAMIQPAAGP